MNVMVTEDVQTHLKIRTAEDVNVKIFPDDADVLVFYTRAFVRVIRRSKEFAKIKGRFRVGRSLFEILRSATLSQSTGVGTFATFFRIIDDCALSQLTREVMESILRLFDVYAAGTG